MALTMDRIAPAVTVLALLAIASLARPMKREGEVLAAETARVRDLQRRVGQATARLEGVIRRDSLLASLPSDRNTSAPLLVLDDRLPAAHQSMITRAVQRQWRSLRMDSTSVPVVIAVVVDTASAFRRFGSRGESFDYVVPSAADGGVSDGRCIAITTLHSPDLARADRRAFSERFATPNAASQLLGPCAFVARFGIPGAGIDRWLRARSYDLAAYPRWYTLTEPDGVDMAERWRLANTNNDLMRGAWLPLSREALGCAAGSIHHCSATLPTNVDAGPPGADGDLIMMTRTSDRHWTNLAPRYLSDLVTALGPGDFRRFWQSTVPPNAALSAVAARPLEVWTHQWAVGLIGEQRVGAAVSFADLVGALSLAGLSLAIAAWGWSRRQVR